MRAWFVILAACGGGSSSKPVAEAPKPVVVAPDNGCAAAYATYEQRWRTARAGELADIGFDAPSIDEVISIEVALLPTKSDLEKLRGQYVAVAVFLPDAPWPLALDAAAAAIALCGEEAPKP